MGYLARWMRPSWIVLALAVLAARPAFADANAALEKDHGWPAGSIQEQLDRDPTLVPFGKGSIFVPSITNPLDEPPVTVSRGSQRVAEGTTGVRIVVAPGTYEVRLGSGPVEQRMRFQATVRERMTTVLPVSWAALSVHVVDEQFGSLRGAYEMIRVDDREYIGIGFGTDEQAGEPLSTWILPAGLYKIVRLGETYRARRDFSTVRLESAAHTHFILVQDQNGEFRGAGEVPVEEIFRASEGVSGSLIVGADASLNSRRNALGLDDGEAFSGRLFVDARLTVQILDNPLVLRLQVAEGQTKALDAPWQKTDDIVDLDALYLYRWTPVLGPYFRVGADTRLLPGFAFFEPAFVERNYGDGRIERTGARHTSAKLSRAFGLSTFREGGGLNMRVIKTLLAEMNVRLGLGGRHRFARNLFEVTEDGDSGTEGLVRLNEIESSQLVGAEGTVLLLARLTRWVFITAEAEVFLPTVGFSETILELEAGVAIKLTSYLALNYLARFRRDPGLQERDSIQQNVVLRFSWELL